MRSYLYFTPSSHKESDTLLRRLRGLPAISAAGSLQLIHELQIDAGYPAETLAAVLGDTPGIGLPAPAFTEEMRCLPLPTAPDEDAHLLLAAAGIDAEVIRRPLVILRGVDDAQFRLIRDTLTPSAAPRRLADDAGEGFLHLLPHELTARAERLGLALPESCLVVIADYYRAVEKRDPTPDELLILDEAYRGAAADPAVCAPIEFITDDPRCEAAYADLMAKRRALDPDAEAPAVLEELAGVASRYLAAHRAQVPPKRHTVAAAADRTACLLAAHGASPAVGFADRTGDNAAIMATRPLSDPLPLPEDRLLWVSGHRADALNRFFGSAVAIHVRRSLPVEPNGLITALGRMLGGSGLGLCFSDAVDATPAQLLQNADHGVLLACAPGGSRIIPDALRKAGLSFRLIAAVQKEPVCRSADNRLRFPTPMLAPRPAIAASIMLPQSAEAAVHAPVPPMTALLHSLASPAAQRLDGLDPCTAKTVAQYPASLTCAGGRCLGALACTPAADPFGEVLNSALALIARLIAAGAPLEQITLAMTLEAPMAHDDPTASGRTIAAMLALHTVQVELGVLSEPPILRRGDTLCVRLSASAPAPHTCPPLTADRQLWLAVPHSAFPHLAAERDLFAVAEAHIADGGALIPTEQVSPLAAATRAALRAGLALRPIASDAVQSTPVRGGMLFARSEPPAPVDGIEWIPFAALCLLEDSAVIIDTEALPLAQAVSALRGDLPAPVPSASVTPMPPRVSLRRPPRPRVLIPYCESAPDALAHMVRGLGGEVSLIPLCADTAEAARQSFTALSDALAGAHILLLGTGQTATAALLTHRRFGEALAAFRAHDGLVCVWGEAFAACLAHGLFSPQGERIDTAPMSGQRMLCHVLQPTASPWTDTLPAGRRETVLLDSDPLCPLLTPAQKRALAEAGCVAAWAAGTPDGLPAITALTAQDGTLLGQVSPPAPACVARALKYFA